MNQSSTPIVGVQLTLLGMFIGLSFDNDVFWVGALLVLAGTVVVGKHLFADDE